jgi:hypothetical protein
MTRPAREWSVHFPDREPLTLACCPPVTFEHVLQRYPGALAAVPVDDRVFCAECSHLRDDGHCAVALAGELAGVPRHWQPEVDLLRRCASFEVRS